MNTFAHICRSCGSPRLESILSLGATPLANRLLTAEQLTESEPVYPLRLAFCPHCALVQITETVPPQVLFRDYLYFSSFSDAMLQHARTLTERVRDRRSLDAGSLAVEIASNDGYLLQYYRDAGIPVLGIEPAENIAKVAEERGIRTRCEFFGADLACQLRGEGVRADVIHANNVLAHVADLNGFVRGIRLLLKDDGLAVLESPYLGDLLDRCEFDTIYHEHLCYYSLTGLDSLFKRHGLLIRDIEQVPIHGGTLRLFVVVSESADAWPTPAVSGLLRAEMQRGLNRIETYRAFAGRVENLKATLRGLLTQLKREGKSIAAYGAAAKGSTLLNYCGIGREFLDFVADRSTVKQGRYMPGVHLPICAPEKLLEAMPDYTLLLTWNFADEILAQQAEYQKRGGRFILPIPEPHIVLRDLRSAA